MITRLNVRHFSNRMEITFWSIVIPLLPTFQSLLRWVYTFKSGERWERLLVYLLFWAALGLLAGLIAGSISAL
jgi:hypothetical protein